MKKMIIIGVGVLLLAAIAGGAIWFLKEDPPADGDEAAAAQAAKIAKPVYTGLDPEFIVAFQDPKNARFLKIGIEVMARDDDVIEDVRQHMPAVRDSIIMMLSGMDESGLFSAEGKQQLRMDILAAIQKVLEENGGKAGVEAVYFTNFVMQ
jgi:flagellar FliL protein